MHGRVNEKSRAEGSSGHRARLRQRLLRAGPEGFQDYELVEYLLALSIPRVDTKPLAKRLVDQFGGIGPLLSASADTLKREGVSEAAAAALKIAEATALRLLETRVQQRPILSSWDALGDYLQGIDGALGDRTGARAVSQCQKHAHRQRSALGRIRRRSLGPCPRSDQPRHRAWATALIIVHNHPSGDSTPSQQDIRLTRDLVEAGRHMKIVIHDHVIVGTSGRSSLRALGLS